MGKKSIVSSTIIASLTRKLSLSILMTFCLSTPILAKVISAEIVNKPIVNDDKVTLRIKVQGENNKPEMNLKQKDFQVLLEDHKVEKIISWKNAQESVPAPTRIVVLLDFSGSMRQLDARGQVKFTGAINAIRALVKVASQRGGDTQIAIVPFGESGGTCQVPPVNEQTLDTFLPATNPAITDNLNTLAKQIPCASTNLYDPLITTVNFLTKKYPPLDPSKPEEEQTPPPRLSVILLSDGFHNLGNETQEFNSLKQTLAANPNVIVHTLGYGQTPEELGLKYKCDKKPARRIDIGQGKCKVPEEAFVDRDRLKEIANLTNGIASFSATPEAVSRSLEEFLNSILGEYQITYQHPNPERGKTYKVEAVVDHVKTKEEYYRFLWAAIPLRVRLIMLLTTLIILGLGGVVPFLLWGKHIKKKALED